MSHHLITASLVLHNFLLAAAPSKSKSSSYSSLIFIVFIVLIGYFLLIRPQRQRARRQQAQTQEIAVGDEVMLTSGIIGRVVGFDGDRATLEISEGIEIEVVRRAIGQRLTEEPDDSDDIPAEATEPDPGAHDEGDDDGDYPHTSADPTHDIPDEGVHGPMGSSGSDSSPVGSSEPGSGETDSWPPTAVHPDGGGSVPGGGLSEPGDEPGTPKGREPGKA